MCVWGGMAVFHWHCPCYPLTLLPLTPSLTQETKPTDVNEAGKWVGWHSHTHTHTHSHTPASHSISPPDCRHGEGSRNVNCNSHISLVSPSFFPSEGEGGRGVGELTLAAMGNFCPESHGTFFKPASQPPPPACVRLSASQCVHFGVCVCVCMFDKVLL